MEDNLKLRDIIGMNKTQLDSILKKDLVAILTSSSSEDFIVPVEDSATQAVNMSKIFDIIEQRLASMENNIISSLRDDNKKLTEKLDDLEYINNKLAERVAMLERNHWQNAQYQRRNNIEIVGIPSEVGDSELENKVCDIFNSINVKVMPEEIEACHRLPYAKKEDRSKPQRSIVKLMNRKKCESAMKNRKKLKDVDKSTLDFPSETKIFLNDNLCPYYRGIYGKCKSLHRNKKSFAFWSLNGIVRIKIKENSEIKSITHDFDLHKLFPNVKF